MDYLAGNVQLVIAIFDLILMKLIENKLKMQGLYLLKRLLRTKVLD